ncbi:MAG: PPC domain-containing protein [Treponema sp.]|nr:PPC domain-containing protein [Treponema sp.]
MKKLIGIIFFGLMISMVYAQTIRTIAPGSSQTGTLQGTAVNLYTITVPAGRLIVYTESNMDTLIRVYNSDWDEIAFDDDSGNELNARVSVHVGAGTYTIGVAGWSSGAIGPYTLFAATEPIIITPVTAGRPHNSILQGTAEHLYSVTVPAGRLTVYTESNLDTLMTIYNADWEEIAYDDDSGDGYNARVSIRVPAGTYTIEVRGWGSGDVGPYTLHASSEPVVVTALTPGRPHNTILQGTMDHVYSVTVPTGRLIVYTESSLDTLINVYNAQGIIVAMDDDSGDGLNAYIDTRVPAGTYTIEVRGWSSGDVGPYTLFINTQ